ncbi:OmpP1/FadL family transporter [Geminicoccus flavidas]|uniref:OmpP1/FadL family transporter n=1 Tax=Geminicoccus flavidas TaxID=2506407 RepID=UPI00135A32FB|nr:OmpP1/FadL family transporter [Geminicoccus flavidas]
MSRLLRWMLLGTCALHLVPLAAEQARASGYAIREQSAVGQGSSFAGMTAGEGGLSAMFFNPAALGFATAPTIEQHITLVVPDAELVSSSASTVLGTPIGGRNRQSDVFPDVGVPALYGAYPLDERWTLGLAVNAPYGLGSKYDEDWVGRYHAVKSKLFSVNATPTIAYRPVSWLTLGGGISAQYIHAELTNAVDFGTIGAVLEQRTGANLPITPVPGAQDGKAKVEGDDIGFGVVLGAIAEPVAGTRLGVSYRSQISQSLKGDADFDLGTSGMGAIISAATGQFVDGGARASLTTPTTVSLGFSQVVGSDLTLLADLQWTDWSQFDELRIDFDNPAQAASATTQNWSDTWFASVGAAYRLNEQWTLRAGAAFDQSPVPNDDRTPRIPDADRYWLSAGVSWAPWQDWTFDLGYSHIFLEDTEVDLTAGGAGNATRGNLSANYESQINIIAVAARVAF